jgi:predicted ATPase
MADVFISYASSDPGPPAVLEEALEAAGHSVWRDPELMPGERYQDVIIAELNAAAAVIVVWSGASVLSEWVYSEARRANAQRKLVQVRTPDVGVDDLPAPFDAFHCPSIADVDAVLRAVRALVQLASAVTDPPAEDREEPTPHARGSAGSLPVILAPIVGRERELAELGELVRGGQRLVTLVGPGGTGKTRLAVALGADVTGAFPDGVCFAPLASARTAAEMWGGIATALAVPPEAQQPPALLGQVAAQRVLLVLDNLEQIADADVVVRELLQATRQAVVVATSRRPLHVAGEQQYEVQPLALPEGGSLEAAALAPAVRMFVQTASMVRRDFALTEANVDDVVALCEALDGLPLALELTAARTKMLSPSALLARIEQSLDVPSTDRGQADRQISLRNTIAWSFELLGPDQQTVLERLCLFEGGGATFASLEAVVPADVRTRVDVSAVVFELVDASLARASEDAADGEPRFGLLETVKRFLRDRLRDRGDLEPAAELHARQFLGLAETWQPLLVGDRVAEVLVRFEAEHDNMRAALAAMLEPEDGPPLTPSREELGLRLCSALASFWKRRNHLSDRLRWSGLAVKRAVRRDSPWLADCLGILGDTLLALGQHDAAYEVALESATLYRRLGHRDLPAALTLLAAVQFERGESAEARAAFEESVELARQAGDLLVLQDALSNFASLEAQAGNHRRSLELETEALDIARATGDTYRESGLIQNLACTLRMLGRVGEAHARIRALGRFVADHFQGIYLISLAEDYGAILADLGDHPAAARLFGAAEAARDELAYPRDRLQETEVAPAVARSRAALPASVWDEEYGAGRSMSLDDLTAHLIAVLAD